MAPKKKMTLITLSGSKATPVPIPRHIWSGQRVVKDYLWDRALKVLVEASPALEYKS